MSSVSYKCFPHWSFSSCQNRKVDDWEFEIVVYLCRILSVLFFTIIGINWFGLIIYIWWFSKHNYISPCVVFIKIPINSHHKPIYFPMNLDYLSNTNEKRLGDERWPVKGRRKVLIVWNLYVRWVVLSHINWATLFDLWPFTRPPILNLMSPTWLPIPK